MYVYNPQHSEQTKVERCCALPITLMYIMDMDTTLTQHLS